MEVVDSFYEHYNLPSAAPTDTPAGICESLAMATVGSQYYWKLLVLNITGSLSSRVLTYTILGDIYSCI